MTKEEMLLAMMMLRSRNGQPILSVNLAKIISFSSSLISHYNNNIYYFHIIVICLNMNVKNFHNFSLIETYLQRLKRSSRDYSSYLQSNKLANIYRSHAVSVKRLPYSVISFGREFVLVVLLNKLQHLNLKFNLNLNLNLNPNPSPLQ